MKFSSLRINAKYHLFQHDIFNPHPRFSHVLGQFPPCIFLCTSYLEASKPFFLLLSPKYLYLAFLQTIFLVTIVLISFWMNQWHTFPALLTSCIFPALPGFQLTICLWSVLPQQASAPNLAFAVCSQGSLSFHLPYFLLNLCFLLGDFSWFSCCNNHFINLISICEHEEIGKAENSDS